MTQYFSDEIADRSEIKLGEVLLDVFLIPSTKTILLSRTQTSSSIGKPENSFLQFLKGKSLEASQCKVFQSDKLQKVKGSNKAIAVTFPQEAALYWKYWLKRGNKIADNLVTASIVESITRRADKAFGIVRGEEEYNKLFNENMNLKAEVIDLRNNDQCWKHINQELNQQLEDLSLDMANPDILKEENARLMRILRKYNINPEAPENYI
ncbi:MAG: hypothetical protein F6K26_15275 [Moorea sp. SIO2I5]|nr:hypothetical protein [Moorena sp. SIO2I5]